MKLLFSETVVGSHGDHYTVVFKTNEKNSLVANCNCQARGYCKHLEIAAGRYLNSIRPIETEKTLLPAPALHALHLLVMALELNQEKLEIEKKLLLLKNKLKSVTNFE